MLAYGVFGWAVKPCLSWLFGYGGCCIVDVILNSKCGKCCYMDMYCLIEDDLNYC